MGISPASVPFSSTSATRATSDASPPRATGHGQVDDDLAVAGEAVAAVVRAAAGAALQAGLGEDFHSAGGREVVDGRGEESEEEGTG
jgi:hypothetical protein